MRFIATMIVVFSACSQRPSDSTAGSNNLVLVKGGTFINTKSNLYDKHAAISDFYIGKYEVTQKEWMEIMKSNPSQFIGDDLPVEMVSWYDVINYCNKRSIKEGLKPYYNIDKTKKDQNNKAELDDIKWTVTTNASVNGYRLPTEAEWEYAAGGGQMSKSYVYSGGNNINDLAWYWRNSGDTMLSGDWVFPTIEQNNCKTKRIGSKEPNELGLYDMSGNVREWCEDWYEGFDITSGFVRVQRGGGWLGIEDPCKTSSRDNFEANGKGSDQGVRVCRSK